MVMEAATGVQTDTLHCPREDSGNDVEEGRPQGSLHE